jgi:hypothetical protein
VETALQGLHEMASSAACTPDVFDEAIGLLELVPPRPQRSYPGPTLCCAARMSAPSLHVALTRGHAAPNDTLPSYPSFISASSAPSTRATLHVETAFDEALGLIELVPP